MWRYHDSRGLLQPVCFLRAFLLFTLCFFFPLSLALTHYSTEMRGAGCVEVELLLSSMRETCHTLSFEDQRCACWWWGVCLNIFSSAFFFFSFLLFHSFSSFSFFFLLPLLSSAQPALLTNWIGAWPECSRSGIAHRTTGWMEFKWSMRRAVSFYFSCIFSLFGFSFSRFIWAG